MQEKYIPFERPERPINPPEYPTIPEGISGWYQPKDDEFIPDEDSFEYALENWDMMPAKKRQMFKEDLIDMFFGDDWERIRGE